MDQPPQQQACDELLAGVRLGKLSDLDWSWLLQWKLDEDELSDYERFLSRLNAGEAACLAMAIARDCRVLTDDRDAREFARRLRVPISGTLGVLARVVEIGALSLNEADSHLSQMTAAGYRSPVVSLREII